MDLIICFFIIGHMRNYHKARWSSNYQLEMMSFSPVRLWIWNDLAALILAVGVGSYPKLGRQVVMWGHNLPLLVDIGLTDLPKPRWVNNCPLFPPIVYVPACAVAALNTIAQRKLDSSKSFRFWSYNCGGITHKWQALQITKIKQRKNWHYLLE